MLNTNKNYIKKVNLWLLSKKIYENDHNCIYDVEIDDSENNISPDDINELTSYKWIMKVFRSDRTEIDTINNLCLYESEFIIKMPSNKEYRSGYESITDIVKINYWYVMEKYDCDISYALPYCYDNFNVLALYLINFIEWLHIEKKQVHGDIKYENIVVNHEKNQFRVIDYESIGNISDSICINYLPNGYYYFGLGCEYNTQYFSYRMDLQAIGYLLCYVLENIDYNDILWRRKAFKYYDIHVKINYFKKLNKMRNEYLENIPKTIKKYFNIISNLEWSANQPDQQIYTDLKKLFT
jgi:hypothetical protein